MKDYLKMADIFGDIAVKVRGSNGRHVMCEDILAANCFCTDSANYIANAINSHDELVAEVERLTKSAELAIMTLEEVDRVLTERVKNGAYDLDDISGEVTYALDKLSALE